MEYKVFEHFISVDGEVSKSYGVEAVSDGKICESYSDISLDREKVEKLAELLNGYGAELVHFREIIDDFHCDNS